MISIQRRPSSVSATTIPDKAFNLLIVDDEEQLLLILGQLLSQIANVRIADCGEKALEILELGYHPEVILSDQRMPGINGAEFLAKSRQYVPEAVRVIMTGYTDLGDIVASINQGNIYKFIAKPWKNEELLLTIKQCFEHYQLTTENKHLLVQERRLRTQVENTQKEVEAKNADLINLNKQIQNNMMNLVRVLSSIASRDDHTHSSNHAQGVAMICKALAAELRFDENTTRTLIMAALLHDIGKIGLAERCITQPAHSLDAHDLRIYQSHVERGWEIINSIQGMEQVARIILQHHECEDGSGFPNGLESSHILVEAQVLNIANYYHNRVYQLSPQQKNDAEASNSSDSAPVNEQHIKAVVQEILSMKNIYRPVVINAFGSMVFRKTCPLIQITTSPEDNSKQSMSDSPKQYNTSVGSYTAESTGATAFSDEVHQNAPQPAIIQIPVSMISLGVMLAEDIITRGNIVVLRKGNIIDYGMFQKIRDLRESRSIPAYIRVYSGN